MRWSFRIGSILGFPIRVHISLVLFMGIVFIWGGGWFGLIVTVAIFASVIVHELGHALVARLAGLPIGDISLYPFGGMARMLMPPRTSAEEIRMASAGPIVSLALGGVFLALGWLSDQATAWVLAEINLMLGAFNLIPALPMDGGRILRAYLARKMGFYRATSVAARLARYLALAIAVIGAFYSGWLLVLAFFMMFMASAEEVAARSRQFMGDPGYQDVAPQQGIPWNSSAPLTKETGPRITRTDWEIILPSDLHHPPSSSGNKE
jgi:Zn-dependent protease